MSIFPIVLLRFFVLHLTALRDLQRHFADQIRQFAKNSISRMIRMRPPLMQPAFADCEVALALRVKTGDRTMLPVLKHLFLGDLSSLPPFFWEGHQSCDWVGGQMDDEE